MGNYRFKLSDMMPHAWLHKLKDKKAHPTRTVCPSTPRPLPPRPPAMAEQPHQPRRQSYYFPSREEKGPNSPLHHPRASDTLFPPDPPRKSKKKARKKQASRPSNNLVSSVSASWSCRATLGSVLETAEAATTFSAPPADSPPCPRREGHHNPHHDNGGGGLPCFDKLIIAKHYGDYDSVSACSRSSTFKVTSSAADAAMDVGSSGSPSGKFEETELTLRPILTKPVMEEAKFANFKTHRDLGSKAKTTQRGVGSSPPLKDKKCSLARSPASSTRGLRMRATSPRLASRRTWSRRSTATGPRRPCRLSESFAVVKVSSDPQRDFRDSMMEMILENNMKGANDLEDLLACYLSLNSEEYHDVIVKAFEQIWFDLSATATATATGRIRVPSR